jgi:phospholipase/carboxylesterase
MTNDRFGTALPDPHADLPVRLEGAAPADARLAMVLVHGRGADAADMLGLARHFAPGDAHMVAPEAANNTWYPNSFLAPLEANEPHLSSAIRKINGLLDDLEAGGLGPERTVLLGFSQGACLATEVAARRPKPYAGVVALSGGLIGSGDRSDAAPPEDKTFEYGGSLEGVSVFLGCSDSDPHIPVRRVEQTAETFERLGASVTKRIYPGMGHTVNEDEVDFVRHILDAVAPRTGDS